MRIGIVLLALCLAVGVAEAQKPFEKGSTRLSVGGAGNQNGFGVAFGAGYFVVDGLELGLDTAFWLGDNGNQLDLMPGVKYVFHKTKRFKPYLGAFFHRIVYSSENRENVNSVGGRAGFYLKGGRHFFGVGVAYEKYLDCEGKQCEQFYPEFSFVIHL
jgi:hypothetical protein